MCGKLRLLSQKETADVVNRPAGKKKNYWGEFTREKSTALKLEIKQRQSGFPARALNA